jgi:uncharacterized protein with ParB-like and HNH nuclease domain
MPLILTPGRSKYMARAKGNLELFEPIPSEQYDSEVSLQGYEILSYPADFTLEVLVGKWKKEEIKIPPLQRRFIWSQVRASKLIESFLMGLPVPPVFFYQERGTNKLLVVDGQQRLRSIVYFFAGTFGESDSKEGQVPFTLTGLSERSPYSETTYQKLRDSNEEAFNKLNNSVLRSFVVKQIDPQDDTSIFQIFERLNTGGVILQGQEIRNCIYDGAFNDSLNELNKYAPWRKIFGSPEDKRKRDIELILRFLALFYSRRTYEKPMKQFLNTFMKVNRRADSKKIGEFEDLFRKTCDAVIASLGEKPFHIHTGLNAAVYDSIFTVFAGNLDKFAADYATDKSRTKLRQRFEELTHQPAYIKLTSTGTTDEDIIPKRIKKADKALFE